jgi:hypothetical protein
VMAMGGYTGTDPWPTLSNFEEMVAQGKIHYVLVGSAFASFGFGGHFHLSPAAIHYFVELIHKGGLQKFLKSSSLGEHAQSGPNAVDQWVQKHGTLVSSTVYGGAASGTLYYVSGSARSS